MQSPLMDADADRGSLQLRISTGQEERARIRRFVRSFPDQHIHVLDLSYRLASPAYASSSVALWETGQRELAGFAVWQPAFKMLDFGMHPGHGHGRLAGQLI